MALTEAQILAAIEKGVAQGCLCGHAGHVVRFFDRMEALGSGNIDKGIESFAKSISMMTKIRHMGERVGGEIAVWAFRLLILGLLGLIGWGVTRGAS